MTCPLDTPDLRDEVARATQPARESIVAEMPALGADGRNQLGGNPVGRLVADHRHHVEIGLMQPVEASECSHSWSSKLN